MGIRIIQGVIAGIVLLASGFAGARGPAAVRKQVEASMLVTGSIQVDGEGKVAGFSLDQKEKIPVGVVNMLDKALPTWRFEPVLVAGRPADVTTDMSVRLVAKKLDDGDYSVSIRSAGFGDHADRNPKMVKSEGKSKVESSCTASLRAPRYPDIAARSGVASSVYLLLKTDRDGRVLDVIAEQVNLKVVADEHSMARWRKIFTDASLAQARKWCIPPSGEKQADAGAYYVARVPVLFHFDALPRYGQWEAYVPGPRLPNPWEADREGVAFSPDTLLPGRIYFAGAGLKLLTDPSGS